MSVEHTLSLYITADVYSSSSRQGACEEIANALRLETQYSTGPLIRNTVGAALVEVFAVILPVEATTPLVDAPPDIGNEHGVCDA